MSELVIASQLPEAVNARLAARLPGVRIEAIEAGTPQHLPADAGVLFASPMKIKGRQVPDAAPPGWPWGLRWVQLMSSGIDAYPDWLFDLPVATARGSSAPAIAEFALATILAAAKQLPGIWLRDAAEWDWTRRPQLASVRGSVIGLVGFGAIGQALASRALALGARVLAVRRSDTPLEVPGVERAADLRALFSASDHVVLAAPKPGLHLINVARGGLIDQEALLEALDRGQVGLASLDVTEPEPLPAGHAFYRHPRVHLSPHLSASSADLFDRVLDIFVLNLEAASRAGAPALNLVGKRHGQA